MKNNENEKAANSGKKPKYVKKIITETILKYKLLSFGIVAAVCLAVVFSLIPPLILGKIIDMFTAGQMPGLGMVIAYFAMLFLTGLTESAREGLLTVFGQKITHAMRSRLMEKFTSLTADELNGLEPGSLVSRFIGDVDMIENLFTSGIISMFADACKIISILVVIWFKNKGLTLVFIILLPFLFIFTRHVQKNMLAAQIMNRRAVSRASGHVPQTLKNIRTIHCFGKEKYMEKQYDEYINDSYHAMEKTNFYDAVYSPVILILNAVVVAAVMLLSSSGNSAVLTFFGMSAGTAVAVMNYISQIFSPVESLGMEIQTIQSAIAGIHRINEFMALEEVEKHDVVQEIEKQDTQWQDEGKPQVQSGRYEAGGNKPFVELRNVTFGYDEDRKILNNINISVMHGEQVTLSGRTGAGKSTIFKLLLGLYKPQSGEVLINGIHADTITDKDKRKLFAYVEQTFHMVAGTVKEQITLFDDSISDEDVKNICITTGLDDAITSLEKGYDTICTPDLFSQGQWQLLSIARAAVAKPQLLLLDEITANLDTETEKAVLNALNNVCKDRTVISISHRVTAKTGRIIPVELNV